MFGSYLNSIAIYRGADNFLARPGRKQATATKLELLQATQKISEFCPSNQVSATTMISASDKNGDLSFFFSRIGLRTYQHSYTYKNYFLPQHSSIKIYQFVPQHFKMRYSNCWLASIAVCLHVFIIIYTCKHCTYSTLSQTCKGSHYVYTVLHI